MAAKVKIRGKVADGVASVKTLMSHPMETGTRRDPDGNLIPAHYIETVTCSKNDQEVLWANWGASVSKNPYFAFKVKNAAAGDVIRIAWVDNRGETASGELVLK
jgi:sulfur-oxidizing protein SoxZ